MAEGVVRHARYANRARTQTKGAVLKKWLSYRERPILGRALRPEEAREVTATARRLAALVLLRPTLDANYRAVKADAFAWPAGDEGPPGGRMV